MSKPNVIKIDRAGIECLFVTKSDHDAEIEKLEARCKELEEKIRVFTLSPSTISSDLQRAFEKEHSKAEILKKENRRLKVQLAKCKEQRNDYLAENLGDGYRQHTFDMARELDEELDSITIDSIKRGE